jgi:hypothetical protein
VSKPYEIRRGVIGECWVVNRNGKQCSRSAKWSWVTNSTQNHCGLMKHQNAYLLWAHEQRKGGGQ